MKYQVIHSQNGNVKAVLGILIFSAVSFVITFATVWLALIGPENPFVEKGPQRTRAELARADSLRVVENAIRQQIKVLEKRKNRLNKSADSLTARIAQHTKSVQSLRDELTRLAGQVGKQKKERMKKLSGIVSGLSDSNLKRITEDLDVQTLVSLVMNSSGKRAKTIMNAMNPKRAAIVAREMSRIKGLKTNGG